ncbi:MAG: iron ABC transporter substrate-binding protein [Chloroflexi bacterium]|nr:iron ABC transporter substrate-binding protein [Chloroflexota bacterium]
MPTLESSGPTGTGADATGAPSTEDPSQAATGPCGTVTQAEPALTEERLTVYSGRNEELVAPIIACFTEATGIAVDVRYGDTAELAGTILEEGENSPADVFFAQDAGALGALAAEGRLVELPGELLSSVPDRFRSPEGRWVGVSGRARVVAYNTHKLTEDELPDSILDYTDPAWEGRIGWAPTNGSLQSFVTAFRQLEGDEAALAWLEGIQANEPMVYDGNTPALEAVASGAVDVAFINHYYLFGQLEEQGEDYPAANQFLTGGDPGALVNVAGVGVLDTSGQPEVALQFAEYLLSEEAQTYFAQRTYEYPLIEGVALDPRLPALDEIGSPELDLSDLADLQGTLDLMREAGVL